MPGSSLPTAVSSGESVCRLCGNSGLNLILSLGQTPLSSTLLTEAQVANPEPQWPLDLVWCPECSLTQIAHTVSVDVASREYGYFASFSDSLVQSAKEIANDLTQALQLSAKSLVIEVGSNDGYLLQWYKQAGIPVLGIEVAQNIARMAQVQKGIPTRNELFTRDVAKQLKKQGQQADVVHANNVLTNATDLNAFVGGLKDVLKPDGVLVVEVPYLKDMIDGCDIDTIYHEHVNYFSLTALDRLFRRCGLMVCEVERLPLLGGSIRIYARHLSNIRPAMSVVRMLAQEDEWAYRQSFYRNFGDRVECLRMDLVGLLKKLKSQSKRIAAYGVTAKSSTLLNYLGIGADLVDYAVDQSKIKQGRFTPGSHLKIYDPDQLLRDQPDYCLLLNWDAADEVIAQQQRYREAGGKFIIPLPNVRVA